MSAEILRSRGATICHSLFSLVLFAILGLAPLAGQTNPPRNNALVTAVIRGELETVRRLVEQGADVNSVSDFGLDPLAAAASEGNFEIVKFLVEHGANTSKAGFLGVTVLNSAIKSGNPTIVDYLLKHGANPKTTTFGGDGPFFSAIGYGKPEIVEMLLNAGVTVDFLNSKKQSGLMAAATEGKTAVAELLLNKGAQTNLADIYGKTALIAAAEAGSEDIVKRLLARGAEPNASDQDMRTALEYALARGSAAIVTMLKSKTDPRLVLNLAVDRLKQYPWSDQLRKKIIEAAIALNPPPPIPAEARALYENAQKQMNAEDWKWSGAVKGFHEAASLAPWFADAYQNAAKTSAKIGENYTSHGISSALSFEEAAKDLDFYLSAAPRASDAEEMRKLRDEMIARAKAGR